MILQVQAQLQDSIDLLHESLEIRIAALEASQGGPGPQGPRGERGPAGPAGADGKSYGDEVTDYLIPAGIGLGTSILINAVWPHEIAADAPASERPGYTKSHKS